MYFETETEIKTENLVVSGIFGSVSEVIGEDKHYIIKRSIIFIPRVLKLM